MTPFQGAGYLAASEAVARYLAAEAEANRLPDVPGFYRGQAGILFYYTQLFAATKRGEYAERALSLARSLVRDYEQKRPLMRAAAIPNSEWGFYSGASGVAFALMHTLAITDDAELRTFTHSLIERICSAAVETAEGPVWSGAGSVNYDGGTILFLLTAARIFGKDSWRQLAIRAGRPLLAAGIAAVEGGKRFDCFNPAYFGIDPACHWPNFELGTAGVAYTLLRLYEESGDAAFRDAAVAGADYVRSVAVLAPDGDAALIPYRFPDYPDLFYLGYCHGPVGTARLYYLLHKLTGDSQHRAFCDKLVRGMTRLGAPENHSPGYWQVFSQCCGTAGMVNLFLGLWVAYGESGTGYLSLAERAGTHILGYATATDSGGVTWYQAFERIKPTLVTADSGYSIGAAGIGMALLQLHGALIGGFTLARLPDDPFPAAEIALKSV